MHLNTAAAAESCCLISDSKDAPIYMMYAALLPCALCSGSATTPAGRRRCHLMSAQGLRVQCPSLSELIRTLHSAKKRTAAASCVVGDSGPSICGQHACSPVESPGDEIGRSLSGSGKGIVSE